LFKEASIVILIKVTLGVVVPGFRTDFLRGPLPLGVAVSAGADSIALLHLLHQQNFPLIVLHVDHGFRSQESAADCEFVAQQAASLGLSFLVHRPEHAPGNQEQAARNARYHWFHSLIQQRTVSQVATGHTLNDQAETVLFRFLRGAGTAGLSAILPETAQGIVRPLLLSTRADLLAFLQSRHLPWREDSSNNQLRFARNRIRHKLLPQLEAEWNPNLTRALAQTASWAQAEEAYWNSQIFTLTKNWLRFEEQCDKRAAVMEVAQLKALPLAVSRRIIRWAVSETSKTLPEFPHVERVLALAARSTGHGSFRTRSWHATRSFGNLRIASVSPPPSPYSLHLTVPGSYQLPAQSQLVRLELSTRESVYNDGGHLVDWSLISGSLELRNWHPGDRFPQAEHRPARKLTHFFQEAGIPSWERSGWPVITCANEILWTRGQGVSPHFSPTTRTATILRISESPNQNVFL
jgi:tRNA(Ile)-lysidine synthase